MFRCRFQSDAARVTVNAARPGEVVGVARPGCSSSFYTVAKDGRSEIRGSGILQPDWFHNIWIVVAIVCLVIALVWLTLRSLGARERQSPASTVQTSPQFDTEISALPQQIDEAADFPRIEEVAGNQETALPLTSNSEEAIIEQFTAPVLDRGALAGAEPLSDLVHVDDTDASTLESDDPAHEGAPEAVAPHLTLYEGTEREQTQPTDRQESERETFEPSPSLNDDRPNETTAPPDLSLQDSDQTSPESGWESEALPSEATDFDPKSIDQAKPNLRERTPRRHRPSPRNRVVPAPRTERPAQSEQPAGARRMAIDVRLLFEKGGFCRVSLMPRRESEMADRVSVSGAGAPEELIALQDDWFQDVSPGELGRLLAEGIEWAESSTPTTRWSLAGRDLFVLKRSSDLSGYLSAPILVIGEDHVVLCKRAVLDEVRSVLSMSGTPEPVIVGAEFGVPEDWVALRGIVPKTALAPSESGDFLDALRPRADVAVALEKGIKIDRSTWLSGFPPSIQVRGEGTLAVDVSIDGKRAAFDPSVGYVADGWDAIGEHVISGSAGVRSYKIVQGAEEWARWDAHDWKGETCGEPLRSICGASVRDDRLERNAPTVWVSASNPILIGANPGEIDRCVQFGEGVQSKLVCGTPSFRPVWALPADGFRASKSNHCVRLVGSLTPAARHRTVADELVQAWCRAIRAASNKRLRPLPSSPEVLAAWTQYGQQAKAISRLLRHE